MTDLCGSDPVGAATTEGPELWPNIGGRLPEYGQLRAENERLRAELARARALLRARQLPDGSWIYEDDQDS